MRHPVRTLLLTSVCVLVACKPRDPWITPTPIPPGYDFPGSREEIQQWADAWNTARITPKAWNLWAGLHADSGQVYPGTGLPMPIWDTWSGEELFPAPDQPTPDVSRRKATHGFHGPRQFHHPAGSGPVVTPTDQLVSFNKFNPEMAAYLTQGHPAAPGGPSFFYNRFTSLADLNSQWPANTPTAQRTVQQAPYTAPSSGSRGSAAMELKPVLYLVKKHKPTPVPVWRGLAGSANSDTTCTPEQQEADKCHPTPSLWLTCAIVDPTAPADAPITEATAEQIQGVVPLVDQVNNAHPGSAVLSCEHYLHTPLSALYSFQMTADEAKAFNSTNIEGLQAEAGDYAVLTAMHVNTKELLNWTWQTFWWQPGSDAPDDFPGSKKGMTDKVTGAGRNYAMCTAYNQTQGKGSSKMTVCFNPYLETSPNIPVGVQSNCMTCHGTAAVASAFANTASSPPATWVLQTPSYPCDYKAPIDFATYPWFTGFTTTDFSWAIPADPQPLPQNPNNLPSPATLNCP
ncbi:hypothetical protein JYJ95_38625 [Corallococcus exiguus]|uniref:hypothetical protein n=1 Tax=Corallococcus exiguus TaxID=83462 RepID=UPI001A8CD3ED|nr:hypothetical protein [Corallococcus exiguus]MBN8472454.1 hypothetical protein [Corallococcus exiguus]